MADTCLCHDRNRYRLHDLLDKAGVGHARHSAFCADHGRNAFKGHDGGGTGFFGDAGLFDVHDVHNDAALEHLSQADFYTQAGGVKVFISILF